ncbi:hypothetical protein QBC38DRAFT_520909 [Podospora fimiseda]|uniref:NB-ARC domain-containing protein n=1 Tax=Podospora fimiseda TaxID=252190 RepID=A0AAN7BF81_9PEZI|nr:hypothetical protein QBC38DRAFT_520909 [Podospora fimiseda]
MRILPSQDKDDCQRTGIEGLGGVGKTQIALEAAYRIGDTQPDCSVFWVPAVNATTFENAYRAIAQQLKLPVIDEEKAEVKALGKTALSRESRGNWLLIIDNARQSRLVASQSFIVPVEEMSREEAIKLLGKNLKVSCPPPSSNTQASAYMAKKQISTTEYLELCKSSDEDMIELLSKEFEDRHRYKNIQNAVATTWLISFQQILDYDPLAADYLRFMCFLAGKDIPQSMLPPAGRLKTVEAIGTLKAYAFISQQNESDSYDIHRLVQISMMTWLAGKGEQKKWTAKVLERLQDVFPWPGHENREEWIRYLPHTQYALQLWKITGYEKATADLLCKYEEAEQMHRQALQLREKVLGKEHPSTLTSINDLLLRQGSTPKGSLTR